MYNLISFTQLLCGYYSHLMDKKTKMNYPEDVCPEMVSVGFESGLLDSRSLAGTYTVLSCFFMHIMWGNYNCSSTGPCE